MAKRYSDAENALLERLVNKHTSDGKISWDNVATDISAAAKPGAVKTRYYRLVAQNGVKPSSRSGDKTLKRVVKWLEKLVESKALTELLKKKNKELWAEIKSLKKELKSHGPILKWYIDAQRGFKIAKEKKALIE